MASRAVPLVLNNEVLGDGEHAFLLDLRDGAPGYEVMGLYEPAPSFRASRMKMSLLVQIPDTAKAGVRFTVRSPFAGGDPGRPVCAPTIFANDLAGNALSIAPLEGGVEGSVSSWPADGSIGDPAPGYSDTFNDKAIPNWSFLVFYSDLEVTQGQFYVTVDFSHSIT